MTVGPQKRLLIAVVSIILFLVVFGKTGRCVVQDNQVLFWGDAGDVVTLSPFGPLVEKSYRHLETGDKVLVIYFGVKESYPGQTTALCCVRLWKGSVYDFTPSQISELMNLGWLD